MSHVQPLRIAHIHWAFPPTTGGVESHLFDLARLQTAAGHTVTVVTGEPNPTRTGEYEIVSTSLLDLDAIRDAGVTDGYATELRRMFGTVFGERGIDVVHSHDLHHFTPEPALALTKLAETFRLSLHHSFHETWPDVLSDQPVYRSWSRNYAVSAFVQRGCQRRLGFKPLLFPLAVDTNLFRASRPVLADSGTNVLLHPARLLPWKGVHFTLRMLAMLRDRGLTPRLLLTDTQRIADWDRELDVYRETIRRLIQELDLTDQVEFVRPSFAEMPALYDRADVVLYPTVADEPFGLVPLEAMSCERPVVASRCGGITETIVDSVTGFTTRPGDVRSLATRVAQLLSDPLSAQAMGAAGRRHVLSRFDIDDFVRRLDGHYARSRLH